MAALNVKGFKPIEMLTVHGPKVVIDEDIYILHALEGLYSTIMYIPDNCTAYAIADNIFLIVYGKEFVCITRNHTVENDISIVRYRLLTNDEYKKYYHEICDAYDAHHFVQNRKIG